VSQKISDSSQWKKLLRIGRIPTSKKERRKEEGKRERGRVGTLASLS
jgi:hypothetical protein